MAFHGWTQSVIGTDPKTSKNGAVTFRAVAKSGSQKEDDKSPEFWFLAIVNEETLKKHVLQYIKIGKRVILQGRLKLSEYTNQNGEKQITHVLFISDIVYLLPTGQRDNNVPKPKKDYSDGLSDDIPQF